MKKVFAVLMALMMLLGATAVFAADITVTVNGEVVDLDRDPYIENGKVMIPLRLVIEKLGASVAWDGETKTIFTMLNDAVTTLQIGNINVFTTNDVVTADVAPVLVIDRTFVTEYVLESAFGIDVTFDEAASMVTIVK